MITLESKVKSPWNPTTLLFASTLEVVTAAVKPVLPESKVIFGRATLAFEGTSGATVAVTEDSFCDDPLGRSA